MNNLVYKAEFQCSAGNKNKFSASSCMLSISVGQPSHESEKFLATIKAVNSFKECAIFVDDSLQRHTLAMGTNLDAEDFYEMAMSEGDRWIDRNQSIYSKLMIPYKIVRWNHWLDHSNYIEKHKLITSSINADPIYKSAFDETIVKFLERYSKRKPLNGEAYKKAAQLCLDYLIEECAAMCLWIEDNYNFQVYPFRRNNAMKATYKKFIQPHHPNLLIPLSIEFKEYTAEQFAPAVFDLIKQPEKLRLAVA
jgi:hypothetical protein